jgi:hypothetical protein
VISATSLVFSPLASSNGLLSRVQEKSKMCVPRWEGGTVFVLKRTYSTAAEFFDDAVLGNGIADQGNSKSSA